MGKREVHICDVCKCEVEFDSLGSPKLRAAQVNIQLYKKNWGDPEYLASWKGELCDGCVALINRAAEAFHRELQSRFRKALPGESLSVPEAELPKKKRRKKR